ncbi:hypothetical protein [Rubritalea tangerina]|uniref:hypothetical protein n=1 Tax=Rubritalea tangerina TaxID=430798 RepID=UPI00360990D9
MSDNLLMGGNFWWQDQDVGCERVAIPLMCLGWLKRWRASLGGVGEAKSGAYLHCHEGVGAYAFG